MLQLKCPHCGVGVRAPDEKAGTDAKCPKCKKVFKVESPSDGPARRFNAANFTPKVRTSIFAERRELPDSAMERRIKRCPFCAEEILAEALKCKHCGELLNPSAGPTQSPERQQSIASEQDANAQQAFNAAASGAILGCLLFVVLGWYLFATGKPNWGSFAVALAVHLLVWPTLGFVFECFYPKPLPDEGTQISLEPADNLFGVEVNIRPFNERKKRWTDAHSVMGFFTYLAIASGVFALRELPFGQASGVFGGACFLAVLFSAPWVRKINGRTPRNSEEIRQPGRREFSLLRGCLLIFFIGFAAIAGAVAIMATLEQEKL